MTAAATPGTLARAVALGAVCGARTFAAAGMAALRGRYGRSALRTGLLVAAGGELVADKLPAVLGEATRVPDPVLGLLEDVVVLALAAQLTRGRDASRRALPAVRGC